jgi:hypothetical protein
MALITPLKGLAAPTSATLTKACSLNGPEVDVPGMIASAILAAQELQIKLVLIVSATDSADPNLTALNTAVTNLG